MNFSISEISVNLQNMTNPGEEAQDDPEEEEKNDKLIKTCGQCEFAYETLAEIMFHVKNTPEHSPQCVHCKSTFADFANYRKHLTKFHMKKGDIICSDCGKISKTEEQARFHRNNVHKLEDDLFCNICGSQQPNLSKLRNVSVMTLKNLRLFIFFKGILEVLDQFYNLIVQKVMT